MNDLDQRIESKKAEIAAMQSKLEWHARRGRPDGTTEHDIMRRLQKELLDLMEEFENGKSNMEGIDLQTGQFGGRSR
jgi:hemerythrin-like domain-containing protein